MEVHSTPDEKQLSDSLSLIDERSLVRRLDIRLVPVLIVLYLMAFLDRLVSPAWIIIARH